MVPGSVSMRYRSHPTDTAGVIDTRTNYTLRNSADPDAQANALGTLLGMLYPHLLCASDSNIPAAVPTLIPTD